MQIVPRRFCHISTKMSVLCPSKYAKIRFRPGFCPGPRWGSSRRSPRPPSRLKRGHPSPYHTPLSTNPPSAIVMRPPQNSSQIYVYAEDRSVRSMSTVVSLYTEWPRPYLHWFHCWWELFSCSGLISAGNAARCHTNSLRIFHFAFLRVNKGTINN